MGMCWPKNYKRLVEFEIHKTLFLSPSNKNPETAAVFFSFWENNGKNKISP